MKKFLSLILTAAMLLTCVACLSGCSGSGTGSSGGSDPLSSRGIGESADNLPAGVMMTKAVYKIIPDMLKIVDSYLDGDIDDAAAIEQLNAFRKDVDFSMAHTHDIAVKKHLDKIIKFLKETEEPVEDTAEETAEGEEGEEAGEKEPEPTKKEKILEQRNAIAAILELEIRETV